MKLRPYQSEACKRIMKEFEQGIKRTLLVLPTGLGKTIIYNGIAFKHSYNPDKTPKDGHHVLVLAHQNILLQQGINKFKTALDLDVEWIKGKKKVKSMPIAVCSVQSMQNRLHQFPPDYFDLIIIDEAHHSMSAGYKKILEHFDCRVLGVTATPDRADGKKLEVFESIAFQYSIDQAIKDGYLTKILVEQLPLNIDLGKIRKSHGDLVDADIGGVIEPHLHEIARTLHDKIKGRRAVCFVPLIRTAQKAAEIFSHYGFRSQWVSGNDPDRAEKLKGFEDGEYDIIFNSMLLTEGWDCPQTDCVIILRPTTSRALYVQMVGRGLRLAPGKEDCLLVDFLFQNDKFNLASPADVLGKNRKKADQTSKEKEEAGEGGGEAPEDAETRLAKALEEANQIIEKLADPHDIPSLAEAMKNRPQSELFDPEPTAAQIKKLRAMKLNPFKVTYSEAEAILKVKEEQKKAEDALKAPTRPQIYRLSKLGFTQQEIGEMNFLTARKKLSQMKAMGRW